MALAAPLPHRIGQRGRRCRTACPCDQAVYDYWQPDQVLMREDAVPIDAPTHEEAVQRKDLRGVLGQVLAELPESCRRR